MTHTTDRPANEHAARLEATFDAYVKASTTAWRVFLDYRSLRATEAAVQNANRAEHEAADVHRAAIAATVAEEVSA